MQWPDKKSELQEIKNLLFDEKKVRVFMLRDDLLHPGISGNKWRKLKYNVLDAWAKEETTLVTVGGSHSNHIAAVAAAGKEFGFKTVGLIRGYEAYRNNPTLKQAACLGMDVRFFDKSEYGQIETVYLPQLRNEIGAFYFVPIGGGNHLGTKGSIEICEDIHPESTHVTVACGTGSTLAGVALGGSSSVRVIGFPVMKNGDFITDEVVQFATEFGGVKELNIELHLNCDFGGFGKMTPELIAFINDFYTQQKIPLDGVYNGKMMFGLFDKIRNNDFKPGSVITAIHTGGVQGNKGLMDKYKTILPL